MIATRPGAGVLALALVPALLGACQPAERVPPAPSPTLEARAAPAPAPGGSPLSLSPPAGWHAWPHAPPGCAVFVPDDLDALAPPPEEACGRGCRQWTAPWATDSGWGFGGLLSAARRDGATWLAVSRSPSPGWWESLLLRDGELHGAFRVHLPGSGCVVGGPWLEAGDGDGDGAPRAALVLVRASAQQAPTVMLGRADRLTTTIDRVEQFGPPDAALLARDVALLVPGRLVVPEHGGRFSVRTLGGPHTWRPAPDGTRFEYLQQVTPALFYASWDGERGEIWRVRDDGSSQRVLAAPELSFDALAGDAVHVAWTQSSAREGINRFGHIELWAAAVGADGTLAGAHRVATLPAGELPLVSVGEGWVAARLAGDDVRVYPVAGGRERRLPVRPGIGWDGGPSGLAIAGGELLVKGYVTGSRATGGNDVRIIARFDIGEL